MHSRRWTRIRRAETLSEAAAQFEVREGRVLAVHGNLDFANVARTWRTGEDVMRQARPLVLDLAGVARADSAGLACVLALLACGQQFEPDLAVRNPPESLRALARVSGAETWLS